MLYSTGSTVALIADDLGVTESSVRTRVNTLGLLRRRTRSNPKTSGNEAWLIGPALSAAIPVPADDFCVDLLSKLGDAKWQAGSAFPYGLYERSRAAFHHNQPSGGAGALPDSERSAIARVEGKEPSIARLTAPLFLV